jgi:hypothetical protein
MQEIPLRHCRHLVLKEYMIITFLAGQQRPGANYSLIKRDYVDLSLRISHYSLYIWWNIQRYNVTFIFMFDLLFVFNFDLNFVFYIM